MSFPHLNATDAATVTPSDTVLLGVDNVGLYVGVTGDITATTAFGTKVLFKAVPVGFFPVKLQQVWATGTTATNMLLLK